MQTQSPNPISENVPRYTSYPTAPHFHAGVDGHVVAEWLGQLRPGEEISLYLHVPFCDKLCWFCACHTKHTRHYRPVAEFLVSLREEIRQMAVRIPAGVKVGAIHFGGGSPTMLIPDDFVSLMRHIRACFAVDDNASISVEIDPNDMDEARHDALVAGGLTRASLGVQDFDPTVQKAINRSQSFDLTRSVVEGLRARGVASVNLDLLYGLPHQTEASVEATVRQALSLKPDRIALFGYAHVPWFKKHQTMIHDAALPGPAERLAQYQLASSVIVEAGYEPIGIDHFALPSDSLARAARENRLRRNFQGYTDDRCETLIGLGPSSVSRYRQGYAQNVTATAEYQRSVGEGNLPIARGIELSKRDLAAGWLIERLMCDFAVPVDEFKQRFGDHAHALLAEAAQIAQAEPEKLVRHGNRFVVPENQRPVIRTIAARFDSYLAKGGSRHSAAV